MPSTVVFNVPSTAALPSELNHCCVKRHKVDSQARLEWLGAQTQLMAILAPRPAKANPVAHRHQACTRGLHGHHSTARAMQHFAAMWCRDVGARVLQADSVLP